MSEVSYCYVVVRTNVPVPDQVVQVGHACHLAGRDFHPGDHTRLVVTQVPSQEDLKLVAWELARQGVRFHLFTEPDDQMGETALCTEPLGMAGRPRVLRRLPLWS